MTNFFKHRMRRKSPGEIVGWVILAIIGIVLLAILMGYVIMWLWNWLIPELFGLATITYWQAVGLFVLFKILLGGCGGSSCGSSNHSHSSCKNESKRDRFSKWKYYDKFWEEKGEKAFDEYLENIEKENDKQSTND